MLQGGVKTQTAPLSISSASLVSSLVLWCRIFQLPCLLAAFIHAPSSLFSNKAFLFVVINNHTLREKHETWVRVCVCGECVIDQVRERDTAAKRPLTRAEQGRGKHYHFVSTPVNRRHLLCPLCLWLSQASRNGQAHWERCRPAHG